MGSSQGMFPKRTSGAEIKRSTFRGEKKEVVCECVSWSQFSPAAICTDRYPSADKDAGRSDEVQHQWSKLSTATYFPPVTHDCLISVNAMRPVWRYAGLENTTDIKVMLRWIAVTQWMVIDGTFTIILEKHLMLKLQHISREDGCLKDGRKSYLNALFIASEKVKYDNMHRPWAARTRASDNL